jgi:hypothetical protein
MISAAKMTVSRRHARANTIFLAAMALFLSGCAVRGTSIESGGGPQSGPHPVACGKYRPSGYLNARPAFSVPGNLQQPLVPGNPVAVTQCEYSRAGIFTERLVSNAATAGKLAAALDADQVVSPQSLPNCPLQWADAVVITFSYASGAEFSVGHALSGCHIDLYYTHVPQLMALPSPGIARLLLGSGR